MLEITGLSSGYLNGPAVLHDASLTVDDGEVVALIGLNGAGKSTLVRTIYGLLSARTGSIVFNGSDITAAPCEARARSGLMLVPEGRELCLSMTVRENLALGSLALSRDERRRISAQMKEKVMDLFPVLDERSRQVAGTLSGGQQQMLAIARALMADPKLLILDEPSLGLAPQLVGQIFDSLRELNKEGLAVLLVEQNAEIAWEFSTRTYELELGHVSENAPADNGQQRERTLRSATDRERRSVLADIDFKLPEYSGVNQSWFTGTGPRRDDR